MVSERMVSSVMTPPALRMTWASPTSRPSIPNSGIRESMQATTATARRPHRLAAGEPPRPRLVRLEHPVDLGHAHLRLEPFERHPIRRPRSLSDASDRMMPHAHGRGTPGSGRRATLAAGRGVRPARRGARRVLARDVSATVALPGFDNSAMDGYAARWAEIASAAQAPVRLPVVEDIPAGVPTSSRWSRAPCTGS